ncbi:MAG TPA: hypothetical protein VGR94_10310 [Candidatus Acidoferrales bacterium]|nr:hypothetical protein [Candidatus Acidoferrales bacterium]
MNGGLLLTQLRNGRHRAVRNANAKALLTRGNRSRKSGRAVADNENICLERSRYMARIPHRPYFDAAARLTDARAGHED